MPYRPSNIPTKACNQFPTFGVERVLTTPNQIPILPNYYDNLGKHFRQICSFIKSNSSRQLFPIKVDKLFYQQIRQTNFEPRYHMICCCLFMFLFSFLGGNDLTKKEVFETRCSTNMFSDTKINNPKSNRELIIQVNSNEQCIKR